MALGGEGDYRHTLYFLSTLKPDVWLASHTATFNFDAKRTRAATEGMQAWVDPEGYRLWVAKASAELETQINAEIRRGEAFSCQFCGARHFTIYHLRVAEWYGNALCRYQSEYRRFAGGWVQIERRPGQRFVPEVIALLQFEPKVDRYEFQQFILMAPTGKTTGNQEEQNNSKPLYGNIL